MFSIFLDIFYPPNFRWFEENGVFQHPRLVTPIMVWHRMNVGLADARGVFIMRLLWNLRVCGVREQAQ